MAKLPPNCTVNIGGDADAAKFLNMMRASAGLLSPRAVRAAEGLDQPEAGPRYRFWGNRKPPEHRDPIRAQIEATDDGTGTAVMRLYDPIDSWGDVWGVSAKEFAEALYGLEPKTALRLHVNSPGGEVFEGLAILNLLRTWDGPTTVVVDGLAASAASVVAMGGDQLVMMPNSELMIHDAWGICMGNAADMTSLAATLDHLSDNIASAYAAKAGGTVADWRAAMIAESWYGADEAVEAGLADAVWAPPADDEPAPANSWDMSGFRYRGRAAAPAPTAATGSTTTGSDRRTVRARRLRHAQQAERLRR